MIRMRIKNQPSLLKHSIKSSFLFSVAFQIYIADVFVQIFFLWNIFLTFVYLFALEVRLNIIISCFKILLQFVDNFSQGNYYKDITYQLCFKFQIYYPFCLKNLRLYKLLKLITSLKISSIENSTQTNSSDRNKTTNFNDLKKSKLI